jgi:hypothetical protein
MTAPSTPVGDHPVAQAKPPITAAQQALLDHKVLPLNSLTHGAYYSGLLDNTTTIGRWHSEKRRFVFWENGMQQPGSRATPHVADLGAGPRFAPLSREESSGQWKVSDFAFAVTR